MAAVLFNKLSGTESEKKKERNEENKGKGHMLGSLGIILRFLGTKI